MTSTAQVQANRSNAQKSTARLSSSFDPEALDGPKSGPRTAEGKAVAAQNAVRHGLLAQEVVVKGEDPGEFELYRQQMLEELAPMGPMEEMLAQRIVGLSWRLRRAERLQARAYDKIETKSEQPEPTMSYEDASWLLARMVERGMTYQAPPGPPPGQRAVQDFNQERVLDRLLMYERRIEHSLYRTMAELRRERLLRDKNPPVEGGLPRSTGILPVSSMGVPPMFVPEIHGQTCPELAEGDARDTHGRDAHATEPEGGTLNGGGDESCETNPICAEVSSLKSEVSSERSALSEEVGRGRPTHPEPPEGGTPKQTCETNPIRESGSASKKTPAEPRPARMWPNTAKEMTYDSFLGRWVWTGAALANKNSNQANAGRRP